MSRVLKTRDCACARAKKAVFLWSLRAQSVEARAGRPQRCRCRTTTAVHVRGREKRERPRDGYSDPYQILRYWRRSVAHRRIKTQGPRRRVPPPRPVRAPQFAAKPQRRPRASSISDAAVAAQAPPFARRRPPHVILAGTPRRVRLLGVGQVDAPDGIGRDLCGNQPVRRVCKILISTQVAT